ncbi:MAG: hypothetical protein EHM36_00025, partial [Deltaproteobacteria bacterium]
MKIKKFKARSFSEALSMVKKELSEDAVIISTDERKGIRPYVEVTAAIDYDSPGSMQTGGGSQMAKPAVPAPASTGRTVAPQVFDNSLYEIKSEIGTLREMVEKMKNNGYHIDLPSEKKAMLSFLTERSVREEFALRICEKAKDANQLPSLIARDIRVRDAGTGKRAVMLIGPTGVGKT